MKNKGFIMIAVFIWEYILVMVVESLGATTTGGTLLELPTDPTFLEMAGIFFKIFIGLLTFSINIANTPDIIIFGSVYLPLLILFTAFAFFVRGD